MFIRSAALDVGLRNVFENGKCHKPKPLGFRSGNFQGLLVLMMSTSRKNFTKIAEAMVSSSG